MILWYWYFWRYCVALIVRCCNVAMLPKFGIRGLGSTVFATAIVVRTWDGCPAFFCTKILQYFRKSKKRHTAGYTSMYAMYATACGYLFGMFHHTIPWGLFRKHAGQISLLSQSFTSSHPNGRSLSCISLLHRGRGPAAQPFCFFALALRLKKVGHIGFLTYWECLSGCLSLSSHSFLSSLSFLFNSELEDFYTEVGAVLVVRAPVRSCCDCHCDRCDRYTCWVRCWVSSTDTVGHPEKSTLGWHKVSVYVH